MAFLRTPIQNTARKGGGRVSAIIAIMLLTSCISTADKSAAPVTDLNRAPPKYEGAHVVKPGETLYSIAWRYNRDFKELATQNGIKPPYYLKEGQRLSLAKSRARSQVAAKPAPQPIQSTTKAHQAAKNLTNDAVSDWHWPARGKIIQYFSSEKGQKGIDIEGKSGQPVLAAAPGVVVYSGDGLRGYGQLVIIKHNDDYLSAYAHNSRLWVREGDKVQVGQKIADMGQTDTQSVRLHFEIRYKGDPQNPLNYLPKG